jgi:3-phosphoshikimate 1-carboxyvinyltransferase
MHERPQAALFQALRELGYRIESENGNDKLPARIFAGTAGQLPDSMTEFIQRKQEPPVPKQCRVSIEESSQFASALLLSAGVGGWKIEIDGENTEESPYVAMTLKLIEAFPKNSGRFQIGPDASSGSYFWGAAWLFQKSILNSEIIVYDWTIAESQWQRDAFFRIYVGDGIKVGMKQIISRKNELADSIMTAIVLAPFAGQPIKFIDLGRLRVQECERVVALRTELTKCGAKVAEEGDMLTVYPSKLEDFHGAEIETYNDHRMAMCFAILGLKVPGIKIKNPACVKKTFPNFFQKLAAQPPHGLGAEIWEIKNGQRTRQLSGEDLFAD